MIGLAELLAKDVREVIASPELSKAVISYYSKLYAGGQLVRSCNSSKQNYFRRLQIDGIETLRKREMSKYQLNKDAVIRFGGQVYNSSTITDEIAEQAIAQFPKLSRAFIQEKAGAKEVPAEDKKEAEASKAPVKRKHRKAN